MMKAFLVPPLFAFALLSPTARAEDSVSCPGPSKCVPKADMDVFVKILREKQCLQSTKPIFEVEPIDIIIDKEGRVYGSGSDPKPWRLRMTWCGYEVEGKGNVRVNAAMRVEPDFGLRFRPKAFLGLLAVEAFRRDPWTQAVDVGVMVDPLFFRSLNVYLAVGLRSFGAGLGIDITKNFGAHVGYALTYSELRSNPIAGLHFSFW